MAQIEQDTTLNVLRPYYLRHFQDLQIRRSATPIDYEKIVNDVYFRNIIHYRIGNLEFNPLTSYPLAIRDINAVIVQIEEEMLR